MNMLVNGNLQFSSCLFLVLLMLSFVLTVSNVADEEKKEKAFPISVLVVNCIVIFALLLQMFGVKMVGDLLKQQSLLVFIVVLLLSFVLSIQNVSDKDQENKSLPTIVLIVNSIVLLMLAFTFVTKYIK
jgi:hypothetical protein